MWHTPYTIPVTCRTPTARAALTRPPVCERERGIASSPLPRPPPQVPRCATPLSGTRVHIIIDKCARPDMDTWNVKACLFGQAGWPARLREPIYACHGPARTRRASATTSSSTCSTGMPTSAAIASKGGLWGMRGSVDGITSTQSDGYEAVIQYLLRDEARPYLLNWNAEVGCYTLRRGPLGHERIR